MKTDLSMRGVTGAQPFLRALLRIIPLRMLRCKQNTLNKELSFKGILKATSSSV